MKIIMNILGILIYCLNRFANRRAKDKGFNLRFWINDNWPEFSVILLVDLSLLILFLSNDISISAIEVLPSIVAQLGDLTVAWLLGLGLSSAIYGVIRKKIRILSKP